jgi:hypothetical protein
MKRLVILSLWCASSLALAVPAPDVPGGAPAAPSSQPAPVGQASALDTVKNFLAAADKGDVNAMAAVVRDPDSDKLRENLQKLLGEISAGTMKIEPAEEIVDGDVACVLVKTTRGERTKFDALPLVQSAGEWRLVLDPGVARETDPDQFKRLSDLRGGKVRERRNALNGKSTTQPMTPPPPPPAP